MADSIPPNIAQLTGPILLGHLLTWAFYSALCVQTYLYYLAFPKDGKIPKAIVTWVFLLETVQIIMTTRDAFRNFGTGWGDMNDLNQVGWLFFSVPVLGTMIGSAGQIFFAWRIWILSQKLWVPIPIVLISLMQFGGGIWTAVDTKGGQWSDVIVLSHDPTCIWLGGTAGCDLIIAIAMIYYLSISRGGFRSTNVLVSKIMRITVETGLVCAAFAILDLAFYLRFTDNNYHLAPSIPLSKLYSNSLLMVLNSRMRIVGGRGVNPNEGFISFTDSGLATGTNSSRPRETLVTVTKEFTNDLELDNKTPKFF